MNIKRISIIGGIILLLGFGVLYSFPSKVNTSLQIQQETQTQQSNNGIWVSQSEIMSRPTTGLAWQSILSDASKSWGTASVSNQDSDHDQYVLAGALVCARTGQYCDKTRQALLTAIGTEDGGRWLAVGRNMLGYTIATDVMRNSGNLTGAELDRVSNWLANFLTKTLANNNSGVQERLTPFGSGSNASAQEGAVYVAISSYNNDASKLAYAWNRFRLYSCDKTNNPETVIDVHTGFDSGWAHAATYSEACAVNPINTIKNNIRIDGALINDMRRGGDFKFPPGHTTYPWVGLEGYVPAALILQRAGYPAFTVGDNAVLRTHEYLCYLKNNTTTDWWEPSRAAEVKHLVKLVYGFNSCDVAYPVGGGRTVGYTDWTHPLGSSSPVTSTNVPLTPIPASPTLTRTAVLVTPTRTPTVSASVTPSRTPTSTASPTYTPTMTPTLTQTAVSPTSTSLSCQIGSKSVDIWVQLITVPSTQTLRLRTDHVIGDNVRGALYSDDGILWNIVEIWSGDCNNYWGKLGEQMWFALKYSGIYFSDWRE